MKRGGRGVRKNSLARKVTREEWSQGCHFVGRLLGVSPQAAWILRNRLIAEGHDIPKLSRGRRKPPFSDPSESS